MDFIQLKKVNLILFIDRPLIKIKRIDVMKYQFL